MRRLPRILVLILASAIFAAPAAASGGIVGQWKLDEGQGTTVADSSGNGNNGTLFGNVNWTNGVTGSALDFVDGASGVHISDNSALEPASAVTVSAWIAHASSPGAYRYIVAKGANGCHAASYGLYTGPNGGLEFYISRQQGIVYATSPDAGTRVWDGRWHLAVGTFDGTTLRLYVDGVEAGSGTVYPGNLQYALANSNDLYIGDYPGCSTLGFQGNIDEVTIWNEALTPAQIAAMSPPAGTEGSPPPPGSGIPSRSSSGSGSGSSSGSGHSGSGSGGNPGGTTGTANRPKLSALKITFPRRGRWPMITYTDSQAARSTVQILHQMPGLRHGTRCVAPGAKTGKGAHCMRLLTVTSFARNDRSGHNSVPLAGRLRHTLAPGTYRLVVTPRAHGATGRAAVKQFVVRAPRR